MDRPDVTMMLVAHNAFRRDVARMQAAAAQVGDPTIRVALRAGWATFSQYLTIHHTAEDEILWPTMRAQFGEQSGEASLLAEMSNEHSRLDPVFGAIEADLPQGAAERLMEHFAELGVVLSGHLDHEEAAVLPLVQEFLSRAQWERFGDDQRRRVGLKSAGWFLGWLLDDTPPDTRDHVLTLFAPPVRLIYRLIWRPRYQRLSPWRRQPWRATAELPHDRPV